MTQSFRVFACTDVGRDIARGILPVATDWDTDPPNLANITDGDPDTESGEGVTAIGAAGGAGTLTLSLGRKITGIVLIAMTAKTSAGKVTLHLTQYDGSSWSPAKTDIISYNNADYKNSVTNPMFVFNAEAFTVYSYGSAALTFTAKYSQIKVLEVL